MCVQCSSEQPFEFNGANDTSPCGKHKPCEDNFRFEYNATHEGCVPCASRLELDQSGNGFLTTCTQIDDCNCPTGDACEDATNEFTCSRLFNKIEDGVAETLTLIEGLTFSTSDKVSIASDVNVYTFSLVGNAHGSTTVAAENEVDGIKRNYEYTFNIANVPDPPEWNDFGSYDVKDGDVIKINLGDKISNNDGVETTFAAAAQDTDEARTSTSGQETKIQFLTPGNVNITFSVSGAGGTATTTVTFSVKDCNGVLGGTSYRVGRLCRSSTITIGGKELNNTNFDSSTQNRKNIVPLVITDTQTAKRKAFQYTSSLKKKPVMTKADRRDRKRCRSHAPGGP